MLAFTVPLIAAAAAAAQLASPGFQLVDVDPKKGEFFANHFAQQLTLRGVRVTTQNEIATIVGMERQKALMGCEEAKQSCLAELVGALGVDGLVTGNVARLGSGAYVVNVKIVAANDARPLGAWTGKLKDDDAVVDWLSETAEQAASVVSRALERPLESPMGVRSSSTSVRNVAWIPATVGGLALITGVVLFAVGKSNEGSLRGGQPVFSDAEMVRAAARSAESLQLAGVIVGGVGLVALAVGGGFFLFGTPRDAMQMTLVPTGNGFALGGVFP